MQLEEYKNKEESMEENEDDDYLSDYEEENILSDKTYLYKESNLKKKFNVSFYFDLNKNKKFVFPVYTEFFDCDKYHIYDLIKYVVKKINNANIAIKHENKNYSVSLKDIEDEENKDFYINNYEIKPFDSFNKKCFSKFSSDALLKTIENENIIFSVKNVLNIMLVEQF